MTGNPQYAGTPPAPYTWYAHPLWIVLSLMMLMAVGLFAYVGWQVREKRRAQQHISIQERRRFHNMMVTAWVILFSALIGLATALPTVSAYPF